MKKTLALLALGGAIFSTSTVYAADRSELYDCLNNANNQDAVLAKCYLEQAKKDMVKVNQYYKELSENPQLTKWNNGNKMFNGNFRDLLEAWTNYRNRYCSLEAQINADYSGGDVYYNQAKCLMEQTLLHSQNMLGLVQSSVATAD